MGAVYRVKVPNTPDSGKCVAKAKGVVREDESEGRRRQISGLTNRNHIRRKLRIRLPNKSKSNSCTEITCVNGAGRWRERLRSYPGRSHGRTKTVYEVRLK